MLDRLKLLRKCDEIPKKKGQFLTLKEEDLIVWKVPKPEVFKEGFKLYETQLLKKIGHSLNVTVVDERLETEVEITNEEREIETTEV